MQLTVQYWVAVKIKSCGEIWSCRGILACTHPSLICVDQEEDDNDGQINKLEHNHFFCKCKKKILPAEIQSLTSSYCSVSYHYPQASSRVQFFSFGHFLDMDTSNGLSHSRNKRDSSLVNVLPLLYDLLLVAWFAGGGYAHSNSGQQLRAAMQSLLG